MTVGSSAPSSSGTDRAVLLTSLLDDLAAESADLDARVAELDEKAWRTCTPARGWDVHDSVTHLAATDADALAALQGAEAFAAVLDRVLAHGTDYVDRVVEQGRSVPSGELLEQWRAGRTALQQAVRVTDPSARIPWFGPAMSPASFVTARLMETWAHGQDVVDALGQTRPSTARLRSVAEIGVRARPFAYAAHGRPLPDAAVRVELAGPVGEHWTWGPPDVDDRIAGPALDFCLLVTQRRARADLDLSVAGQAADEWASIAQAFAGPPGAGRQAQA